MFRKLDFLNESPQFYIFNEKSNKTILGGVIFIIFIIIMILISLLYFYDYIKNEKYEIEYSRFYSPITEEERELKNSDPLLNPTLNFTIYATRYIHRSFNKSEFAFYDKNSRRFIYNVDNITISKNVSSFELELLYRCQNIYDSICPLREEDKNISKFGLYYGFDFISPSFILDHSKPGDPFIRDNKYFGTNFIFNFNNTFQYSLYWKVIKYKEQEGLFDLIKGKKNEYIFGYLDDEKLTPIPNQYEFSLSFKYRVIGRINLYNYHYDYDQYKRKKISFLTILANIGALFSTFKGILVVAFKFYSNSYDNHKMIDTILSNKIQKYSSYDKCKNDNDINNKKNNKNKIFQLMPINDITDDNDNDNIINNNDDNLLFKNLISNKNDEIDNNKIIHLRKISFINYLLNNIYCKKLDINTQERIETCNNIVKTYMSYESILYNQMILENLLTDYNWNNPKLKYLNNNQLINKLKNLEEVNKVENMDKEEKRPKKAIKWTIIIPIIVLITLVMIIFIIIVSKKSGDQCIIGSEDKCLTCKGKDCGSCNDGYKLVEGKCIEENNCIIGSGDKCLTCKGKRCGSCNFGYKLADGKCIEEVNCIIGEEDKCLTCKGKICGSCNEGYILINGHCILDSYSFKAVYETKSENETVTLINYLYKGFIIKIEIDKEKISEPNNIYTFNATGEHIVYILFDFTELMSLKLFSGITNLKSITFYKQFNNTRNVKYLYDLFYDCTSLESVDMSNFNFENIENMEGMFCFCESLKTIKFPNSTTPNLKSMSYMFWGCSSLTSIDLSYFNTENVEKMYGTFFNCISLTSIDLTNFNTINLVDMQGFLANCNSLTSIDMSNFITDKIIHMNNLFQNCNSLKSIDLSNFNTENVENMFSLFYGCNSLEYVNLSNFKTSKVTDLTSLFYMCESLTSVDISHFDTSNVENMNYMFEACRSLKSLNVFNFDTSKVTSIFGMFAGCSGLSSLNITNFNTENLINMDYFLEEYTSLTSIDLSNFKTEKIPNMTEVFTNCIKLTYIDISNFGNSTYYFNLFRGLPENGTIIINNKIKNKINISDSWIIINVDE